MTYTTTTSHGESLSATEQELAAAGFTVIDGDSTDDEYTPEIEAQLDELERQANRHQEAQLPYAA
jgi:hypothetical protein